MALCARSAEKLWTAAAHWRSAGSVCSVRLQSSLSRMMPSSRPSALSVGKAISRQQPHPFGGKSVTLGDTPRRRPLAARSSAPEGTDPSSLPGPVDSSVPSIQLLLHLLSSGQEFLVQGAAEQRLGVLSVELESQRDRAAADIADADPINQVLYSRMAEIQAKDVRREAVCILYICCAAKLKSAGVPLGGPHLSEQAAKEFLGPVFTDGIIGHLDGILGQARGVPDIVARVATDQIAGLYLGTLEMAYFPQWIKRSMMEEGLEVSGTDCGALLDFAESLPLEVIGSASDIATEEAAQVAREHIGSFFQLDPEEPHGDLGPRYPQLKALSGVQIAPTAHLLENFDADNQADDLRAKAASKASRGWADAAKRDLEEADAALPSPSIIEVTFEQLRLLMLEAAALGYTLWETEAELWGRFPYRRRGHDVE